MLSVVKTSLLRRLRAIWNIFLHFSPDCFHPPGQAVGGAFASGCSVVFLAIGGTEQSVVSTKIMFFLITFMTLIAGTFLLQPGSPLPHLSCFCSSLRLQAAFLPVLPTRYC